jgi:cytosine permease
MAEKINNIAERMDDHALERVPDDQRTGWLKLSWNTAGIVTTLVQMFFGALVSFAAGLHIAIISGIFVTIVGAALGWAVGNVGTQTGLSSTLITREYGLGTRGSCLASLILGFMIIGFLAIENALLYNGVIFFFGVPDTVLWKIVIYGVFTLGWVLLTGFGFELVAKVSSVALLAFLALLAWMLIKIVSHSPQTVGSVLSFGPQMSAQTLAGMGITSSWDAYVFCINVLIGSAGALALVDADFGRYARSSKDIGLAALTGNVAMSIVMLSIGGIVMYAGFDYTVNYFMHIRGLPEAQAQSMALASPSSIASTFIIFGGVLGAILMLLAQSKAQVLNTYSGSLALANFSDAVIGWRPGRFVFVVLANVIGLVMLYGKLLALVNSWITVLGVLTTSLAGVVVADFYIVRKGDKQQATRVTRQSEAFNWAGIVTILVGTGMAHYIMQGIVRIEFFTSLVVSLVLYPVLRLAVFRQPEVIPVV